MLFNLSPDEIYRIECWQHIVYVHGKGLSRFISYADFPPILEAEPPTSQDMVRWRKRWKSPIAPEFWTIFYRYQFNRATSESQLLAWGQFVAHYWATTPGVGLADNTTVRLDTDNEPQPDALLRIEVGGQSCISDDDYVEGAPELIVEIAASTASIDLHDKLNVYRRNQVQEYLVWRVYDQQFDWFKLQEGTYIKLEPNENGIICSETFPGLWLKQSALLAGNLAKVLEIVQQGIATAEHQMFIKSLSRE